MENAASAHLLGRGDWPPVVKQDDKMCNNPQGADANNTPIETMPQEANIKTFITVSERVDKERSYWMIEGEAYDFTSFAPRHPGGAVWFPLSVQRDITTLLHTYHKNPTALKPLLEKYRIKEDDPDFDYCKRQNLFPKLGVPTFLLPPEYDARTDLDRFDFHRKNNLLDAVRKHVNTKEFQAKVSRANLYFDLSCALVWVVYIINGAAFFFNKQLLPFDITTWASVVIMVLAKSAFAAFGHYYVHSKKPNLGGVLFDSNYVGSSVLAADGHVLLHHVYTQMDGDVKKKLLSSAWAAPPLLRPFAYVLHKLGLLFSGSFLRFVEVLIVERKFDDLMLSWPFVLFRLMMSAELWISIYNGKIVPFVIMFSIVLWYNSLVILSGHDFKENQDGLKEELNGADWGAYQLGHAHDLTFTGFKYFDMLISAGLSSHRVHHLLPYQPSGYANIVTEPIVKKVAKDFGVEWEPPRNWFLECFPVVFAYCFFQGTNGMEGVPMWRQHLSVQGLQSTAKYIFVGLIGINAL